MKRVHSWFKSIYVKFRVTARRLVGYPVIYNANKVNESDYHKRALLIYLVKPFQLAAYDPRFLYHQNLKQCRQIASVLGEFGYTVDVVDIKDRRFKPLRGYDLILSHRVNLEDIETHFKEEAIRIYLATGMNHIVHNKNIRERYDNLFKRRGYTFKARQIHTENMSYVLGANAMVGFGNDFTMGTWTEIFKGPTYPVNNFGFQTTKFVLDCKDFSTARKNFLFFGSSNQVGKGLDLLLEIFPKHPDLNLYICSSFEYEKDFCKCYFKELYETSNIYPIGSVKVNSSKFYDLVQKCAYVILPSCSEGQSGSVVQCMYAGLIPIVTKEVGIDTEDFGITLTESNLQKIEKTILPITELPEQWQREYSIKTRKIAEKKFSEEFFINRWREFLKEILKSQESSCHGF